MKVFQAYHGNTTVTAERTALSVVNIFGSNPDAAASSTPVAKPSPKPSLTILLATTLASGLQSIVQQGRHNSESATQTCDPMHNAMKNDLALAIACLRP